MTAILRITLSALPLLAGFAQAHGDPVEQPLQDFVRGRDLAQGDSLLRWSSDLNRDGKPDMLVSNAAQLETATKHGIEWVVYLTRPGEPRYELAGMIALFPDQIAVLDTGEFAAQPAIVAIYPGGGGQASAVAYQFVGLQLKQTKLGTINTHTEEETEQDRALVRKYFEPATVRAAETVPLDQVMTPAQAELLRKSAQAPAHGLPTDRNPIKDPVQFIIDQGGVDREDSLRVVKFDWNEDAQVDYFIITASEAELGGYGNVDWTVYLSDGKGNYSMDPAGLHVSSNGLRVARLDEVGGKQAVIEYGNPGDGMPIYAFYLDDAGRIATQVLATLRRESAAADDDEMSAIVADNEAKTNRFITGREVLGYETIAAASKR